MRGWSNLDVGALLGRLTSFSARRAPLVVAGVVVLSIAAALVALRLDPSASVSTFVAKDSGAARATDDLHRKFGDEPIVILVRGKLMGMLLTRDVARRGQRSDHLQRAEAGGDQASHGAHAVSA